jgi:hypothetical protein
MRVKPGKERIDRDRSCKEETSRARLNKLETCLRLDGEIEYHFPICFKRQ